LGGSGDVAHRSRHERARRAPAQPVVAPPPPPPPPPPRRAAARPPPPRRAERRTAHTSTRSRLVRRRVRRVGRVVPEPGRAHRRDRRRAARMLARRSVLVPPQLLPVPRPARAPEAGARPAHLDRGRERARLPAR